MTQTVRKRIRLAGAAVVIVLVAALLYRHFAPPSGEMLPKAAEIKRYTENRISGLSTLTPGTKQEQQNHSASIAEGDKQEDAAAEARGTGYVWGSALRALFASAIVSADGTKELDVSNLSRACRGFRRPINLADASAPPSGRAEYLAATITAALDRPTSEEPSISQLLERYFAADSALRDADQSVLDHERSRLSRDARAELVALLPAEAREEFGELFASPTFLFVTMCATAERMVLHVDGGTAISSGNATFTFEGDNTFTVNAGNLSFSPAPGRRAPQQRAEP